MPADPSPDPRIMKDRPIIFSGPMVRALLDNRKTMTRRLASSPLRKAQPGDRLWVRENWKPHSIYGAIKPRSVPVSRIFFAADEGSFPSNTPWRPSIFMPRWASRLTLTVTASKIERLQDISDDDALAEGIEATDFWREEYAPSICFSVLWDRLHGDDAWDSNPEVVALSFTVEQRNIDAPAIEARSGETRSKAQGLDPKGESAVATNGSEAP